MNTNKKNILVTGGAGFIGSNFINLYADNPNYSFLNFDKLTYASSIESLENIQDNKNYKFINGDLFNLNEIKSSINNFKPNYIINFAAESHVDRSIDSPLEFVNTNIVGVANLLISAFDYYRNLNDLERKEFKLLHVSTDEVYGSLNLDDEKFNERTPYNPSSPYSASKASSDHLVNAWNHTYGLPTIISNCSNNYGPYQFPEKLIPLIIINCLLENPLPVYGDGKNIRDWIFVHDHCSALEVLLNKGKVGHTYNIGSDTEIKNIDIVLSICRIMDRLKPRHNAKKYELLIKYVDDRPGHDFRYAINNDKILTQTAWKPEHDFNKALEITINWYIENIDWWSNKIDNSYDLSRLGVLK